MERKRGEWRDRGSVGGERERWESVSEEREESVRGRV